MHRQPPIEYAAYEMPGNLFARSTLLVLLAVATGCAAHVAPITTAGANYNTTDDERWLTTQAALAEKEIDAHGVELADPAVASYVAQVGSAVAPPTLPASFALHYHVLRSATANAFALPDGNIYLTVGLLVQLANEAQLAQVLAHETTHVVKRHALSTLRSRRRKAVAAQVLAMATLGVAAPFATIPYLLTLTSYERAQEEDADATGLEMVRRAGYDENAAAAVYEEQSAVMPPTQHGGDSIYSTHPSLKARGAYLRALVAATPSAGGRVNADAYRTAIDPLEPEFVRLLLQSKRFAAAQQYTDGILARHPNAAWAHCARAAAYFGAAEDPEAAALERAIRDGRPRVDDDLIAAAATAVGAEREQARAGYQRCLELDPTAAAAHRDLGLLARAAGDSATAHAELSRYLALAPDAPDRRYVAALLAEESR